MYANPEIAVPNYYELDQLPFLKIDLLNLQSNLSAKRMLSVRNFTHKNEHIMAKIFVFMPKVIPKSEQQQTSLYKMMLLTELPVFSLQNLTYTITEMYQKKQLQPQQWNYLISLIEKFKGQSGKIVEDTLMADYHIRMVNSKNFTQHVYYCWKDGSFRLKVGFKGLGFEVSPMMKKRKGNLEAKEGFVINNSAIMEILKQKLTEKLVNYSKRVFDSDLITKLNLKIEKFYFRDLKVLDQNLLQLKLKHNYPLLRQKCYFPIEFIDSHDGQPLIEPIISNKNRHCMYSHFNGYNSNNYSVLQNSHCKFCGVQIKEMQENKLMMYLRDNLFNPGHCSILYCPQFNRFKVLDRVNEVQIARRKLAELKVSGKIEEEEREGKGEKIEEESNENGGEMRNEEDNREEESKPTSPELQICYVNYMHLLLAVKSTYPLTKKRLKVGPIKEVEYVSYVYKLGIERKDNPFDKFFPSFELTDPARGKFCTHLQFADLRLFYRSSRKKQSFLYGQTVYICPICKEEIKDSELIYLKQAIVIIKYIKKLLDPPSEDSIYEEKKPKKIDKKSMKIIINNVEKKVFLEYMVESSSEAVKQWNEIEKLYPTLVDPYIHFSEYSLGLQKKRNMKLEEIYNFGQVDPDSQSQKLEQEWCGSEEKSFIV